MNKRILLMLTLLLAFSMVFTACASQDAQSLKTEEVEQPEANGESEEIEETEEITVIGEYPDGTYRGIFEDSGDQQVSVQFKIKDGSFSDIRFRHLYYGGTNFTELEESDPLYGIMEQHLQVAEYFEGKPVESLAELYNPGEFVEDVDVASGATLRGNKIFSAMRDGLNRGLYSPEGEYALDLPQYQDGTYRGVYGDSGDQQVSIQFKLEDGNVHDVSFRHLYYGGTDYRKLEEADPLYGILQQHQQLAEYLEGKPLNSIADLHNPGEFIEDVDVASGATMRSNKVYSAIRDGLNRGIYSPSNGFTPDLGEIQDGRYRGTYGDGGYQQVAVQFTVENGSFKDLTYRHLFYSEVDYRKLEESDALHGVYRQYVEALEYLNGQPVEKVYDLHNPGDFVEDVDVASGATIRANKVFSAIIDGLGRGIY
jgi:uncharacterized protein with FMN-binding domain